MKTAYYFLVFLILFACKEQQPQNEWSKTKVAEEVTQMLKDYHTAINTDGLLAEFEYLDNSDDFFWVPPGYRSSLDYDSVQTILLGNAKGLSSIQLAWVELEVFPLSTDIANYSGIVNSKTRDTTGLTSEVAIIESGTLIKRANGWKLLSGQSAVLDNPSNN